MAMQSYLHTYIHTIFAFKFTFTYKAPSFRGNEWSHSWQSCECTLEYQVSTFQIRQAIAGAEIPPAARVF